MGRNKKNIVWDLYEKRNSSVSCKYCGKMYRYANVSRMQAHIIKDCNKCPEQIKIKIQSKKVRRGQETNFDGPSTSTSFSHVSSIADCTINEKKEIDKLIALTTAVTGFPISWTEHALWKKVFATLAPSYQLPTRKTLTNYVDNIYESMKKTLDNKIEHCSILHLQLDGWSNIRNEGILHFLLSTPAPLLVEFVNTLDNRHTSDYLTEEILKVIDKYGPNKFFVLIGDNANNIQRALFNVKELYPHMITLRCTAHTLNLLADDVVKIDVVKNVMKMVVNVVKEIKYSQVLTSLFARIATENNYSNRKLILPVKTRWSSVYKTLEVLKLVKPCLQILAVHEQARLTSESKSHLLDERFWTMVNEVAAIVEPIAVSIAQLEGNECLIQKMVSVWNTLKEKIEIIMTNTNILDEDEKQDLINKLESRKRTVLKPIHFAASLLDPNQNGVNFNNEEDAEAMEFIHEMSLFLGIENVMVDVSDFKSKLNFWGKSFVWSAVEHITPLSWWLGVCKCTRLSKIAEVIFTAPVTSAACERSFSAVSGIHTKKRNKLLTDRAEKIAFISYNWNMENHSVSTNIETENENPQIKDILFVDSDAIGNNDLIEIYELTSSDSDSS